MHEHVRGDDELATFTDQLLAGGEPGDMKELDDLATVVRQLYAVIAPYEKPTPTFRAQLRQRLELEWNLQYRGSVHWWATRRARQVAALAASLLMLVAAVVWFSWRQEGDSGALKGAAIGSTAGALVVLGVVVLGALGLLALYRRKH